MSTKKIAFKVLKISKTDFSYELGYRYNVQVFISGRYSGVGRFCKTLKEVEVYKRSIRKSV